MKCANPLVMEIELDGKLYTTTCRCLKCYACQCSSRAEWAVRCKYEMQDPRNKSCHFITLTYDEAHLPVFESELFDTAMRQHLNQQLPLQHRRYWFSLLRKDHAMQFMKNMNEQLKRYLLPTFLDIRTGELMTYDGVHCIRSRNKLEKYVNNVLAEKYRKTHYKEIWPEDHTFRIYLTGEYGDTSFRSHYHLLCFSPVELTKLDYMQFIKDCWPYGDVNISESPTAAACNYVGKHQVKSCIGTEFQNAVSPIFSLSTRYRGGIGSNMQYDETLKTKWQNSLINHSKQGLYISNISSNTEGKLTEYKVHFPRFLTRIFHPDNLDEYELTDLQNEAGKNLKKFILENREIYPKLQREDFDLSNCDFKVEVIQSDPDHRVSDEHFEQMRAVKQEVYNISRVLLEEDKQRREHYEAVRKHKKLKKFSQTQTNFNSI